MGQKSFEALVQLVQFDQYINTINQEIQKLQDCIKDYSIKRDTIRSQMVRAKESLYQLQKRVHEIESVMADLDVQEQTKKELLKEVSHKKSIDALRREIQVLKQEQHMQEEELLHAWNRVESAQKEYDGMSVQLVEQEQDLTVQMQEYVQEIEALHQTQATAYQQRPEKEQDVPLDWLEKYVRMRECVSDPVVPLIDAGCSSCFFSVSAQERLSIARGALVACKGCYRFLYIAR